MVDRFSAKDGAIFDARTGLEWKVGPDKDTTYDEAYEWVEPLKGGWCLPTHFELCELYQLSYGKRHLDPLFGTVKRRVWAEPYNPSLAWCYDFRYECASWYKHEDSANSRVFAVRKRGM